MKLTKGSIQTYFAYLIQIPKRYRILGSTLVASGLFFIAISLPYFLIPYVLLVLGIAVYVLVFLGLLEDIKREEWFMLFFMPVFWTLLWYTFYFLTPGRWLTRLASVGVYTFVLYIYMNIENILNVSVGRGLPLHRAANTLNHLLVVVLFYIFLQVLFAFSMSWHANLIFSFLGLYGVTIQLFWGNHQHADHKEIVAYQPFALLISTILSFFVSIFSFIPFISFLLRAVILSGFLYVLVGLIFLYTQQKTYANYTREYVLTFGILLVLLILAVQ